MNYIFNKNMVVIAVSFVVPLASAVLAQTSGQYKLNFSSIDNGGGTNSGGPYTLTSTIGQPEAGYSAGGDYDREKKK